MESSNRLNGNCCQTMWHKINVGKNQSIEIDLRLL